jgi:hypothetical protein
MIAALLGTSVSCAVATELDPGSTPSNCTPPLAVITVDAKGLVTVRTAPHTGGTFTVGKHTPHTLVLGRTGYDGSATILEFGVGSKEAFRVSEGDTYTPPGESMVYVYLPGGSVCPNGAPPLRM